MTTNDYPAMTTIDYQWLPMTIDDYWWLPMTTNDFQRLPMTTLQWIPMTTNDYQWLLMTTNDYQWLPMTTNDYPAMTTNDYQWLPCNTMLYHASLIISDGAYHCPVGSILPFLLSFILRWFVFECYLVRGSRGGAPRAPGCPGSAGPIATPLPESLWTPRSDVLSPSGSEVAVDPADPGHHGGQPQPQPLLTPTTWSVHAPIS